MNVKKRTLVASAATRCVRAVAVDDVDGLPLDVGELHPEALAVGLGSRGGQLLLQLLHALVVRKRLRRVGPIEAAALQSAEERRLGLRSEEHTSELQSLRHLVC